MINNLKKERVSKQTNSRNFNRNSSNKTAAKKKLLNPALFEKKAQPIENTTYLSSRLIKDLPVNDSIISNLLKKGYNSPTEIQDKSIEALLDGNDFMGLAQTGTGKTGAFLVPIVQKLLGKKANFQILIISPTRELALQIDQEFKSIAQGLGIFSECIIGGTNVQRDIMKLRRPSHVIIGTPGRISDLVRQKVLHLRLFTTLVLDEFDRLLDMGFSADILRIVDGIGEREQTILFSATEDKSQKVIIDKLLTNPVEVKLKNGNISGDNIDQEIIRVAEGEDKMRMLLELIKEPAFEKVLVFADTKRWVSKICKNLKSAGIKADEIHGNKSQNYRSNVLDAFKNEKIQVLVATDVAARGLDISNVSHVINYQQPQSIDSYIHRIGRTGRAGKSGKAYTFIG
jgi:ATP-dependent RNA helicase RhlE